MYHKHWQLYIWNSLQDDEAEPGAKRQKVEACSEEDSKAHARARAFLQDFAAIPLKSMNPEAAKHQAQHLYEQLQQDASCSPALHRLLAVNAG